MGTKEERNGLLSEQRGTIQSAVMGCRSVPAQWSESWRSFESGSLTWSIQRGSIYLFFLWVLGSLPHWLQPCLFLLWVLGHLITEHRQVALHCSLPNRLFLGVEVNMLISTSAIPLSPGYPSFPVWPGRPFSPFSPLLPGGPGGPGDPGSPGFSLPSQTGTGFLACSWMNESNFNTWPEKARQKGTFARAQKSLC